MEKMINKQTVFLYNVEREKEKQIRILCRELGTDVRKIRPEQTGETIGALMGLDIKKTIGKDEKISEEIMILSGFSGDKLDVFLKGYRNKNIEPVKLKAVVTGHNISWTVGYLYKELKKETYGEVER